MPPAAEVLRRRLVRRHFLFSPPVGGFGAGSLQPPDPGPFAPLPPICAELVASLHVMNGGVRDLWRWGGGCSSLFPTKAFLSIRGH